MRHTYECPLRWADMDLLAHVNNVTYVDYLTEARRRLLAGTPAAGARVLGHQLEFASPLVFSRRPVLVDTWVEAGSDPLTLSAEVYGVRDGRRTTHLRARTRLDAASDDAGTDHVEEPVELRPASFADRPPRSSYAAHVRRADLAPDGTVSDVAQVEHFQESRIHYVMDLHTRGQKWSEHVVARIDVDHLAPVPDRDEPYEVRSWVGHLGTRSFSIEGELHDGERVLTTSKVTMVTFDMASQSSADMADDQRARLLAEIEQPG